MPAPPAKTAGSSPPPPAWLLYERMDRVRLGQGRWLDSLGWGPQETPSRTVLERPGFNLKGYAEVGGDTPVILLVPAPIKRAYIWDLAPAASVVRACVEAGLRPYLVQWEAPPQEAGLAEYGDTFLAECVDAIRTECRVEGVIVAGHSLGGVLAAVFAALNPARVEGLVLLGTPLHFSKSREEGALGPVAGKAGAKGWLEAMPAQVPGSVLSLAGFLASPAAFGKERWTDWWRSLPDREALRTHMRVERWSLDELPLAGKLLESLLHQLYQADAFMAGTLACGTRTAAASQVTAPLLVVAEPRCAIVPPAAILPFVARATSREKKVLLYEGDIGVAIQHVGSLVGRNAHAALWPEILAWTRAVWPKLG